MGREKQLFVEVQKFYWNNKVLKQSSELLLIVHFLSNSKRVSAVQATEKTAFELGIKPSVPVGEGTP